jgi:hypothetical protein
MIYGTALTSTQLNAAASVAGTFTYSPAIGSILPAGTDTLTVTFTPTDSTDYTSATASVPLAVSRDTPKLTWATPAAVIYGTALTSAQLNATASVPGTFTYSPAIGNVPPAGTSTLTITFTPTDGTDYTNATASVPLTVSQDTPKITWSTPPAIVYGTALTSTQLNATASVAGTFNYSPPIGNVPRAGTDTLTVTFTPTDSANYASATASVRLTVSQDTPKITWATPASIAYGTPLGSAQLNATASVPGTFVYSPAAGSISPVGNQTLSATFTPTDATDYGVATASVVLAVINPVPVITALVPAHTAAGGSAFSLTVNGAGFVPTSAVFWGGAALVTQYVNATQLTASVPASAIATAGTSSVSVQTGAPGGGSSGALQFELDSASSLGAGAPSFTTVTATVAPGSIASYPVTLPSSVISSFVSCLNLPTGATCSYANGVLTIVTSAGTPRGTYVITAVFTETLTGVATGFVLPLLLLPWGKRRKRSRMTGLGIMTLAAVTLTAGGLLFAGCAMSGGGPTSPATHQATSSSTITLIVQ